MRRVSEKADAITFHIIGYLASFCKNSGCIQSVPVYKPFVTHRYASGPNSVSVIHQHHVCLLNFKGLCGGVRIRRFSGPFMSKTRGCRPIDGKLGALAFWTLASLN